MKLLQFSQVHHPNPLLIKLKMNTKNKILFVCEADKQNLALDVITAVAGKPTTTTYLFIYKIKF